MHCTGAVRSLLHLEVRPLLLGNEECPHLPEVEKLAWRIALGVAHAAPVDEIPCGAAHVHRERAAGGEIIGDRFGRERNCCRGNSRIVPDDHEMPDARADTAYRRQDVIALREIQRIVGL